MPLVGGYLKSKLPFAYKIVTQGINKVIALSRPYTIYITDSLGGSFKNYLMTNDMPTKINELKNNLDQQSMELVDVIVNRVLHYPDENHKLPLSKKNSVIGGLLPVEEKSSQDAIALQLQTVAKSIDLPSHMLEESVFFFYHGLTLLPRQVIEYIKNQHFMDIGAYVGDSAIALSKYGYSKIFSLEISQKSINRFRFNLGKAGIPFEKYAILNIGVAASDHEPPVQLFDTGSAGFSPYRRTGKYDEIWVERKSLDYIVEQNAIEPKFIKVDIEGAAMDFVKGAKKTLVKFRPVLSIAIYHNPIEFFEVKPALEKELQNYTFLIRKLSSSVKYNQIHSEVVLLGYPNELIV
jgi:FkbM family methyltransferase